MKIVSTLSDPDYAERYRDSYVKCSMWQWGIGDDCYLYFREPMSQGQFKEWCRLKDFQLYMPAETLDLLSSWRMSKIEKRIDMEDPRIRV